MLKNGRSLALVALAAALLTPTALAGSRRGEAPLTRATSSPDADAKGKTRVEVDGSRERFKAEAENIDASLTFELWLEDGVSSGNLVFVTNMSPRSSSEVEAEFDTKKGPLPLGAPDVASLAGRRVEVRSSGTTYLEGTVPAIGSGGGGGGGGGGSSWMKARAGMTRPQGAPDANAKGKIETRKRAKDGRERFKVEAENLDTQMTFFVFLEDALGSGMLQNVGTMVVRSSDEVELELDTGDGAMLPFGETDVNALAGRRCEVRGADTLTYLQGIVPMVAAGSNSSRKAKTQLSGATGTAELRLKSTPKKSSESFELRLKKQAKRTQIDLFLFNANTSMFELVATITTNGDGKGRYRVKTKNGSTLPLGAPDLASLAGVAVEVRENGSGNVLFTGMVPSL